MDPMTKKFPEHNTVVHVKLSPRLNRKVVAQNKQQIALKFFGEKSKIYFRKFVVLNYCYGGTVVVSTLKD